VLAALRPWDYQRRKRGEHLLVRVISYTLTDPARPCYGETYRVLTTLLDPRQAPAHDLACAYHERWEIELVVDELDRHQRLAGRTLRSLKPVGVIQELYGLSLSHYAVRVLMHEAALQADLDPDRLSFVHAPLSRARCRARVPIGRARTGASAVCAPAPRYCGQAPAKTAPALQSARGQAEDVQF
jgi:hypothetical protein